MNKKYDLHLLRKVVFPHFYYYSVPHPYISSLPRYYGNDYYSYLCGPVNYVKGHPRCYEVKKAKPYLRYRSSPHLFRRPHSAASSSVNVGGETNCHGNDRCPFVYHDRRRRHHRRHLFADAGILWYYRAPGSGGRQCLDASRNFRVVGGGLSFRRRRVFVKVRGPVAGLLFLALFHGRVRIAPVFYKVY